MPTDDFRNMTFSYYGIIIPIIAVIGVAGLIGDLCESLMKRDAEVKDSAAPFPGMGGALDLLDSVLYAGPIAWLFWTLWPPGLAA